MSAAWDNYQSTGIDTTEIPSKRIYGTLSIKIPEMSIMIPAFRRANELREALDSALYQTGVQNYEVVVVDNGAEIDEATDKLMKKYCAEHSNVLYHRNEEPLGICGNWNRCLELSRSEYLCILHDDDILLPHYLKSLEPYAKNIQFCAIGVFSQFYNRRTAGTWGNYRTTSDRGKRVIEKICRGKLIPQEPLDSARDMRPCPTAYFYNRSACLRVGGFDFKSDGVGRVDDQWFFAASSAVHPIYILPRNLALRGVSIGESSNPASVYALIVGAYDMNSHIVDMYGGNHSYLQTINQIMLMGLIQSYRSTYGAIVDMEEICDRLKIPEKIRKISPQKIKAVKAMLWIQACFRKEPVDAKRVRKQSAGRGVKG